MLGIVGLGTTGPCVCFLSARLTSRGSVSASAIASVMMSLWTKRVEARRAGEPASEWNKDEINAELACIPDEPDETFVSACRHHVEPDPAEMAARYRPSPG